MAGVSAVNQHPPVSPCKKKDVVRPTVEYHPSVWGDYFIHLPPSINQESKQWMQKRLEKLKEEVKRMFTINADDLLIKMRLVDTLQRLGLAYHFEEEINRILDQICEAQLENKDLHSVALRFRLLRQEGYSITTDEFKMFMDEDGNVIEGLRDDLEGLLSLYDAAYLATHGEVILDQAIDFSRVHLMSKLNHVAPEVAALINHTIETPLHRKSKRLAARHYISIYEAFKGHDSQILELAKLDFNLLLSLHQEEIKNISMWWRQLGLAKKLTFTRDRLVECYFWILGIYFEPSLSRARIMTTKVIALTSILDDIYDAFGTLEELQIFTDIFQRWDAEVVSQLPEYMRIYLIALNKTFEEFEDELAKEGHSYRVDYLKKEMNDLATAYLEEAKWRNEGYIPKFEDHLCVSLITSADRMLACASFMGMGEMATKEAFNWVSSFPKMIKASCMISRLMDDLVTYELEQQREHVASTIQSYMKEFHTSQEETCEKLQVMLEDAWKDINQESLKPTAIPMPFLTTIINLARMIVTLYKDGDEYTHPSKVSKDHIASLLTQPILV